MSWNQYFTIGGVVLVFVLAAIAARIAHAFVHRTLSTADLASSESRRILHSRAAMLTRMLTLIAYGAATVASVMLALSRFGVARTELDFERFTRWALTHGVNMIVIVVGGTIVVRVASLAIAQLQSTLLGRRHENADLEWQRRTSTLSGLLSRLVTVTVAFVAILMLLHELSIDIVPLLTGAGIAGLAVGFGAQNLVRDVISGFFIILEDQIRVGDLARINGVTGGVEEINLRTIVLRDGEGAVQVFPNGTITALANLSKHFAYSVVDVHVMYGEDLDRVTATLKEIGESIQSDTTLGLVVHGELEVLGVESIDDGRATVRVRFKTLPLNQGRISNELRRRIVTLFAARGIRPYGSSSR